MDARRLAYLKALDVDVWERRDLPAADAPQLHPGLAAEVAEPAAPPKATSRGPASIASPAPAGISAKAPTLPANVAAMDWEALTASVRTCTLCPLHVTRTQGVFGVGDRQADWMVIGEAPGADEDRQGEPFVGRAGLLLNSMLKAIGLAREQVFIANILKSRPPNNRDPRPEEVRACLPYLFRQIELVNPRLILCVGRIAAQTLLETDTSIGKLRGTLHRIAGNRPMIVTYHPAYLLRSPGEKRKSWADLLLALRTFEALAPASQEAGS
jgi:uracil-DNA glycosylase